MIALAETDLSAWYTADDGWLKPPFPWLDPDIVARFWAKVDRRGDDECWPWLASTRSKGYGAFAYTFNGKSINDRANRFAGSFPATEIHTIASATFGSKNPVALLHTTCWNDIPASWLR